MSKRPGKCNVDLTKCLSGTCYDFRWRCHRDDAKGLGISMLAILLAWIPAGCADADAVDLGKVEAGLTRNCHAGISVVPYSPMPVGSFVVVVGEGDCYLGEPLFQLRARPSGGLSWETVCGWQSSPVCFWAPALSGTYEIQTLVKSDMYRGTGWEAESDIEDYEILGPVCGNVTITTEEDTWHYKSCEEIDGDLIVIGDVVSLESLSAVQTIRGELFVANTNLTELGLDSVTSVSADTGSGYWDIVITGNASLEGLGLHSLVPREGCHSLVHANPAVSEGEHERLNQACAEAQLY